MRVCRGLCASFVLVGMAMSAPAGFQEPGPGSAAPPAPPAPKAPASAPVEAPAPAAPAAAAAAPLPGHRFVVVVDGKRQEVLVEELG